MTLPVTVSGAQLRAIREQAGISAKELAQRLGYRSASYLCNVELGMSPCHAKVREAYEELGSRERGDDRCEQRKTTSR